MTAQEMSTWQAAGRLARYRIGLFSLSFVQVAAWNGSMLLIGWLLKHLFDAIGGARPAGLGVYELVVVLASAEVVRVLIVWGSAVNAWSREHMRGLLRLNLLRAQMQSGGPDAGTSATSSGEAVSRFRDDVEDFLGLTQTAQSVAGKVVLTVGSMAIMLSVHPVIALAVVLPLVTVVVATRLASRRIRAYRSAYRRASAAVTGLIGEMFGAALAVKSAHAGDGILKQLADQNERRRRTGLRDQLLTSVLSKINRAVVDLSVGIVLLLAASAMRQGTFTIGDLAMFVAYIGNLVWVPYYLGQLLTRHRQAGVSIDRMTALLPPTKPAALVAARPLRDSASSAPTALEVRPPLERLTVCGLTAVHPGSAHGVHGMSFTLERGTFTVVTGPAGAGKTTLLRAILGLVPTDGGTVYWNDEVIEDRAASLVPPQTAYVPQVPRLFSESLRDNILLGHEDTSALRSAVHTAVLAQDVASMPSGLDTEVGARGVRLSGGQVQRTAIARALVRRTDLLVLDDVSSALDVETERRLWDRLLADPDRTLLVVSNRPATIARADQVIRLDHGHLQPGSVRLTVPACAAAA